MTVSAGFMGVGKIMTTNSSLCPHDAVEGLAMTDGYDACLAMPESSCW